MKNLILIASLSLSTLAVNAADFDARAAFGSAPGRDLDAALKRAQKDGKKVFLAVYDPKGDYNNQGLQIKYFTDLEETKKLLKENFVVVLLPVGHKDLANITSGTNLERPRFFLLSSTGQKIKDDTLAQNAEYALKVVKELVALP